MMKKLLCTIILSLSCVFAAQAQVTHADFALRLAKKLNVEGAPITNSSDAIRWLTHQGVNTAYGWLHQKDETESSGEAVMTLADLAHVLVTVNKAYKSAAEEMLKEEFPDEFAAGTITPDIRNRIYRKYLEEVLGISVESEDALVSLFPLGGGVGLNDLNSDPDPLVNRPVGVPTGESSFGTDTAKEGEVNGIDVFAPASIAAINAVLGDTPPQTTSAGSGSGTPPPLLPPLSP